MIFQGVTVENLLLELKRGDFVGTCACHCNDMHVFFWYSECLIDVCGIEFLLCVEIAVQFTWV